MFAFLKLHSREREIRAVAAFLAQLFQGHLEGGERKGPGGKNMWPTFVAGMAEGAVVQMGGGEGGPGLPGAGAAQPCAVHGGGCDGRG
jgi:hypothetical protein